jgi:hypothetical protein
MNLLLITLSAYAQSTEVVEKSSRIFDNRIGIDSSSDNFIICRHYGHPYPWLNFFSFKDYTKNKKSSSLSNWKKRKAKTYIFFSSGFHDSVQVYCNGKLVYTDSLHSNSSTGITGKRCMLEINSEKKAKNIAEVRLLHTNKYLRFEIDNRFDFIKLYIDMRYNNWVVNHEYIPRKPDIIE